MKKYGVIGRGRLGSLLLQRDGFFSLKCDLTDQKSIWDAVEALTPDIIVNLAAISNLDECEKDYNCAIKVNVDGVTNLHKVFGDKVITFSTAHVFNGRSCRNKENSLVSPVNSYGFTKVGAEAISDAFGGKVIRFSRTVSIEDADISEWLLALYKDETINPPSFMYRNFIHRQFAIDGIVYFVENYDRMPHLIHYGGLDNCNFYTFMLLLAEKFGFDRNLIVPRKKDNPSYVPRPKNGDFSVSLAKKLGFPMYSVGNTVLRLANEANL